MLPVTPRIQIPSSELRFQFARSSGPGGQNVNKLNTKATLKWNVEESQGLPDDVKGRFRRHFRRRINQDGEVVIISQRYREQPRNVKDCLNKLREMLVEVAAAPKTSQEDQTLGGGQTSPIAKQNDFSQRKNNAARYPGWINEGQLHAYHCPKLVL